MRDHGKPSYPSDKDVLNETLRSLQELIREVDEVSAPAPIEQQSEREAALNPSAPPAEPVPASVQPTPQTAPPASAASVDFEQPTEPKAGPAEKLEDEPMIEWYSSLTDPTASRTQQPPPHPSIEADDVPLLEDIAVLPGRLSRPRAPAPAQQDLLTPAPEHWFEPMVIAEVTDKTISFLEENLSQASGQPLDHETRVHLRQQIYAALQEWVAATERRLHGGKK